MTPSDEMRGLIERIEASGPDRELDCLIWGTQNGRALEWQGNLLVEKTEGPIGWIDPGEHQRNFGCNRADQGCNGIPAYTRSIDAAMTLAGPGYHLAFDVHFMPEEDVIRYRGYTFQPDWAKWNPHDMEWLNRDGSDNPLCATPALALCAASLRSLSTMGVIGDG